MYPKRERETILADALRLSAKAAEVYCEAHEIVQAALDSGDCARTRRALRFLRNVQVLRAKTTHHFDQVSAWAADPTPWK